MAVALPIGIDCPPHPAGGRWYVNHVGKHTGGPGATNAEAPDEREGGRDDVKVETPLIAHLTQRLMALAEGDAKWITLHEVSQTRVRRIMKQEYCTYEPKQISADAVRSMALLVQLFIQSVAVAAWERCLDPSGRKTLMAKDIIQVVNGSSRFDFLCDVVQDFEAHVAQVAKPPSVALAVASKQKIGQDPRMQPAYLKGLMELQRREMVAMHDGRPPTIDELVGLE